MDFNPTRRNVLSGLGAAASLAAASCNRQTGTTTDTQPALAAVIGTPNRLNLICHGMMLFLWNTSAMDEIEILLPEPPKKANQDDMHKIYFGGYVGLRNLLPAPPKRFNFKLTMTTNNKPFDHLNSLFHNKGGPDPMKDVVLKDKGLGVDPKLKKKNKHRYSIIVPYPTDVRRFRLMNFATTPFGRNAVSDLNVMPNQMAGINVFTYDLVDNDSVMFENIDTHKSVPVGSTLAGLNIHLYSQPDDPGDLPIPGNQHHIKNFNELVDYHYQTDEPKALDLYDKGTPPTLLTDGPETDILPHEFGSLFELPNYPPKAGSREDVRIRSAQPVECLQGWGT